MTLHDSLRAALVDSGIRPFEHLLPAQIERLRTLYPSWAEADAIAVTFPVGDYRFAATDVLLYCVHSMIRDAEPRFVDAGFAVIGFGPNGDPFVVDMTVPGLARIGFLSHEHLYEDESLPPREFFAPLPDGLMEALRRLQNEQEYPCDYWSALAVGS